MKICFFPHYSFSNRDGATLSMYNIIDELLRRGVEVVVVLPNKNHLEERLQDTRIDFVHVPMFSMRMTMDKLTPASRIKFGVKYVYNQSCVNKIAKILKNKNVDCIHINGLDSSVGAKVAQKLNIPYVWHIRAFIEEDLGKKLCGQKETYKLAAKSDAVIGISKDIQKKFETVFSRPVTVVYNGIPREKYDIPDHRILENEEIRLLLAAEAVGVDRLHLEPVGKQQPGQAQGPGMQGVVDDNGHIADLGFRRLQCGFRCGFGLREIGRGCA